MSNMIEDLLVPRNEARRVFVAGKGGVGKTSIACITAIKFQNLAGFSTFTPPNAEYTVTIYTTGAETFSFKLAAETSGA
jgi:ABC-type hemin transport system substrate-binding protein